MANPIVRRNASIGATAAELDDEFLQECFVDTGDLGVLMDCADSRCIALGRTGSGKSALLKEIERRREHVCNLEPEILALNFLSDSAILKFFEEAGVNLELFYKLLWQHTLTAELLRLKYGAQEKPSDFSEWLSGLFGHNREKREALKYLETWGSRFWINTDIRTKEFTEKLETELSASIGISTDILKAGVEGARKLSQEQKKEVVERGQAVVQRIQIKELHKVLETLARDVFDDDQRHYYILIDRLDENWADDSIRFKLLKALLDSIFQYRKIKSLKIIVALRTDLFFSLMRRAIQPGSQEEKYESLLLKIRWRREQLVELLDRRVQLLFKRKYTGQAVGLDDLLAKFQIEKRPPVDFLLDRTFFRPREAILLFNDCLQQAEGVSQITRQIIEKALPAYSGRRLASVCEEWRREYPELSFLVNIVRDRNTPFNLGDVSKDDCEALVIDILEATWSEKTAIFKICEYYFKDGTDAARKELLDQVFGCLYHVGVIGVKLESHISRQWSFFDEPMLLRGQLRDDSIIEVHKAFWIALNVATKHHRAR